MAILRGEGWMLAKDKTDYIGKSRGNTPGNNQAQNKQFKALIKNIIYRQMKQENFIFIFKSKGLATKKLKE